MRSQVFSTRGCKIVCLGFTFQRYSLHARGIQGGKIFITFGAKRFDAVFFVLYRHILKDRSGLVRQRIPLLKVHDDAKVG